MGKKNDIAKEIMNNSYERNSNSFNETPIFLFFYERFPEHIQPFNKSYYNDWVKRYKNGKFLESMDFKSLIAWSKIREILKIKKYNPMDFINKREKSDNIFINSNQSTICSKCGKHTNMLFVRKQIDYKKKNIYSGYRFCLDCRLIYKEVDNK
jgi:hypothetical protein